MRILDFADGYESSSAPGITTVNTGGIAKNEVPTGSVNGSNAIFGPLAFVPSSDTSVDVKVNGVGQTYGVDFTVSGSTITFQAGSIPQAGQVVTAFYLTGGTPSAPVMSGTFRTENRTVSGAESTAKALTLAGTPAVASYVCLDTIGGGAQAYGDAFVVSGTTLSWSGLDLDGVISTGDKLRITYVE